MTERPQQGPSCVNSLHRFGACFYKNTSVSTYLHNKTSVFVNLKGSENKELNHVSPNVYECTRKCTRKNQLADFLIWDFYFGSSKTKAMKYKYVNIGTILV